MSKCKVCGYRLGDGVKKCPMCGAVAGSTVAGNIKPDVNLQKSFCPSCGKEVLGEHRYCPSCGADLKNAGKATVAHAQDSTQSQQVKPKVQTAPETKSSSQVRQNFQSEYQKTQKSTQQNSQHSESPVFQQAQQNVAVQKDKAKPNKTAFVILSAVTVITVIFGTILWRLSRDESLFSVIFTLLVIGAIDIGFHYLNCLSDDSSKGKIISDSIWTAFCFAIIFGCFLYRVVL